MHEAYRYFIPPGSKMPDELVNITAVKSPTSELQGQGRITQPIPRAIQFIEYNGMKLPVALDKNKMLGTAQMIATSYKTNKNESINESPVEQRKNVNVTSAR